MANEATGTPITREDVLAATIRMLGVRSNEAAAQATQRNWLDASGEPTSDGDKVVREIRGQKHTRSVFR